MERNLRALADETFDVVIIGGGIYGVCAAWDATLRGLSVALVEQGDFAQATSSNHHKVAHGGVRYLQHLDFKRVRTSSKERSALLRIAPHLVEPLPIVIPTYTGLVKGKMLLRAGFTLYDALTWDRNIGIDEPTRRIPPSNFISRDEVRKLFPGIPDGGLTGGGVFSDAQIYNPPRLALAFARSAANRGAQLANYVKATNLLREGERVVGVEAEDGMTGDRFSVRGRVVLNASGPWTPTLLRSLASTTASTKMTFSRDVSLVVRRRLPMALACPVATRDADAVLDRGGRHLFLIPWRDHTLVGVWHQVFTGEPNHFGVTTQEIEGYVREVNGAFPGFSLSPDDVAVVNSGLILFGRDDSGAGRHSFGSRSLLIDHAQTHGVEGLVSVVGVRATTARQMAERAITKVLAKLGRSAPPSRTATTPLHGGGLIHADDLVRHAGSATDADDSMKRWLATLARNHGTAAPEVLASLSDGTTDDPITAETLHAVRHEMAMTLDDIVLRRTEFGTATPIDAASLERCCNVAASALGWSSERRERELLRTRDCLANLCAVKNFDTFSASP